MDDGVRRRNIKFFAGVAMCGWFRRRDVDTRTLMFFKFSYNSSVTLLHIMLKQTPFKLLLEM